MASKLFQPLLVRVALVTLIPAAVAGWLAGPFVAVAAGAVLAGLELWRIRRAVVRAVPEAMVFEPANRDDEPWLDPEAFRQALEELGGAGFTPVADYRTVYPGSPRGFARVLVNARHRVYAEVNQVVDVTGPVPVAVTLTSDLGPEWSLVTTGREAPALNGAFFRCPTTVWRSMPGADAPALLRDHLELREQMCRRLSLPVGGDGTMAGYVALQQRQHAQRRAALTRANIAVALVRGLSWERRPRSQWLGAFGGATAQTG